MGSASEVVRGERASAVRYLALTWLCLAAAIAYVHRGCLAVPTKYIQADLQLDDAQMGTVMSAFFLGYAIFQIPSGWLGDRYGTRRTLPVYAVLWSSALVGMSQAIGFWSLAGCQFVAGLAQAGIFPCAVKTISKWFPSSERAMPSGVLASAMSIGAAITTSLTGFLLLGVTWPVLFARLSVPGFLWAAGFYLWFRDRPEEHSWVNKQELRIIREGDAESNRPAAPEPAPATPWKTMLTSPQLGFICGQQFFRAAGYVFYTTWFPTFLQKTRDVTVEKSGYLTTLPLLGVVLGATTGGLICDWVFRRTGSRRLSRQGVAIVGLLICALFIGVAFFVADATQAVLTITVGSFFAGVAGPAGYTVTIDLGGRHVSTVFSTMNMTGNFGASLCPKLVTALVDATSGGWNFVLWLFVAIYLAGAACWAMIDMNRGIFPDPDR